MTAQLCTCRHPESAHDGNGCDTCPCLGYEPEPDEPDGDGTFDDLPPAMEC
jgi:hypothetical protein